MNSKNFFKSKKDIIILLDKGTEFLQNLKATINTFNSIKVERNPYDILGVHPDDPDELIKKIYREKARFYHPDGKINTDSEKFIQLKKAYDEILKMRNKK